MNKFLFLIGLAFLTSIFSCEQKPPNILFSAVDDLRPELNCFGAGQIHSPGIDKLASEGIIFTRAHCQVPVCGASRASILTGIRPKRDRFIDYHTWAEKDAPGIISLPEHFKNNGYITISNGKVFHHGTDLIQSWSEEPWHPESPVKGVWRDYLLPENQKYSQENNGRGPILEMKDGPDNIYKDGKVAEKTIADLNRLKEKDEPFFLAAGFYKPHLPFNAPKKYFDLYSKDDLIIADNPEPPENAPKNAMHNFGELRAYKDIPETGPLSDSMNQLMVHGYYASLSYTDAQIGKVLDELKRLKLDKNTIVILWGDHGWNLGEHGLWCKHCLFETSLSVPVVMRVPGMDGNQSSNAFFEFLDIYPTLCDLAGLTLPEHLQGESMVPYLKDPELNDREYSFSRWFAGESVMNNQYRYSEWLDSAGNVTARMLYDHQEDPGENINIAELPEHQDLIGELSAQLKKVRSEP